MNTQVPRQEMPEFSETATLAGAVMAPANPFKEGE